MIFSEKYFHKCSERCSFRKFSPEKNCKKHFPKHRFIQSFQKRLYRKILGSLICQTWRPAPKIALKLIGHTLFWKK